MLVPKISGWHCLLLAVMLLPIMLTFEAILTGILMGRMPNHVEFLFGENLDFLLLYFSSAPLNTLSYVLLHRPMFIIGAYVQTPEELKVVWGLHFYSYTCLMHIMVAVLLACLVKRVETRRRSQWLLVYSGAGLVLFSSIYLFIASCCTGEAKWLLHTMALAFLSDPSTSSVTALRLYQKFHSFFIWLQLFSVSAGGYLLYRWYRAGSRRNATRHSSE